MKTIQGADLFCGAGGSSTGLYQAAEALGIHLNLIAINHWDLAIATHSTNHPDAKHQCVNLDNVDPRKAVPSGHLDILIASPECMHHSNARGGRPMNDQSRASAWIILRWLEALYVSNGMFENIPEFMDWGPLDRNGRPIKRLKGQTFLAFIAAIRSLNYFVDYRVLNCANYGDPTTRRRLFILISKKRKIIWPEPTHLRDNASMFGNTLPWRSAKEIIDWSIKGNSIYTRKKPLSDNTLRRIMVGLEKFGGGAFTIGQQSEARPRSINLPTPTIAGAGAIALVEPFLFEMEHTSVKSGDKYCCHQINKPLPTVTSLGQWGLIEPYLVQLNGTRERQLSSSVKSLNDPLPVITGTGHLGLVEPFLIPFHTEAGGQKPRTHSLEDPLPTVAGDNPFGLVQPFLVEYYGTSTALSTQDPLPTVTGKSRFGLVDPIIVQDANGKQYMVDILFRMLQPRELASAMSFPADYKFIGNREQVVKQIGNAVPVKTSRALAQSLLG